MIQQWWQVHNAVSPSSYSFTISFVSAKIIWMTSAIHITQFASRMWTNRTGLWDHGNLPSNVNCQAFVHGVNTYKNGPSECFISENAKGISIKFRIGNLPAWASFKHTLNSPNCIHGYNGLVWMLHSTSAWAESCCANLILVHTTPVIAVTAQYSD